MLNLINKKDVFVYSWIVYNIKYKKLIIKNKKER